MSAGVYNITIEQGATFIMNATWKDSNGDAINLTGYAARMQIRSDYNSDETLVSLTDSSGITLGGAAGTIEIQIADTVTQTLTSQKGVYDLELISSGGIVTRLLQGDATISREVTK